MKKKKNIKIFKHETPHEVILFLDRYRKVPGNTCDVPTGLDLSGHQQPCPTSQSNLKSSIVNQVFFHSIDLIKLSFLRSFLWNPLNEIFLTKKN